MVKTIKHSNMLQPNPGLNKDGYNYFHFVCRGCSFQNRQRIWNGFCSSITGKVNKEIDNSYITLEEEPNNEYDPNAVMVVCRGEFFGTMGYVGKEYTEKIKKILNECTSYRIDMVDEKEAGQSQINVVMTWN